MLLIDMMDFNHQAPIVLVSDNQTKSISKDEIYETTEVCTVVIKSLSNLGTGTYSSYSNVLYPGISALEVFKPYANLQSSTDNLYTSDAVQDEANNSTKTKIVTEPKHGHMVWLGDKGNDVNLGTINSYAYEPDNNYSGKDNVTFITELASYQIKVIYSIQVINKPVNTNELNEIEKQYCPN